MTSRVWQEAAAGLVIGTTTITGGTSGFEIFNKQRHSGKQDRPRVVDRKSELLCQRQ